VLKLPGSARKTETASRPNYDRQPAGATSTYVVKKGDTVWDIARKFGTTTATLRRLNGLGRSSRIYVGQKLLVTGSRSSGDDYLVYIVRRGDTLSEIARAFRTSVGAIMRLNGISDATKLRIGARLKISKN
jgi:LysM repeat protein